MLRKKRWACPRNEAREEIIRRRRECWVSAKLDHFRIEDSGEWGFPLEGAADLLIILPPSLEGLTVHQSCSGSVAQAASSTSNPWSRYSSIGGVTMVAGAGGGRRTHSPAPSPGCHPGTGQAPTVAAGP